MIPGLELAACGPLAVPNDVMAHVVQVESSGNPFAIGVVGGRLLRQPRNLAEAAATMRMLEANGHNYSIGLAQVNRINFARFGLDTPEKGFDVCNNLAAGAKILAECLQRHDGRWGDAFSCYYSGNARTGYEHGYVQKVFGALAASKGNEDDGEAIALASGRTSLGETDPAPSMVALSQVGTTDAPKNEWDAVFAARTSAPGASRAQPIAKAETGAAETSFVSVESTPIEPAIGEAATAPRASVSSFSSAPKAARLPDAPAQSSEAQLVVEMQQRLADQATALALPSVSGADSGDGDTPVNNQQSSNSHAKDAARVF